MSWEIVEFIGSLFLVTELFVFALCRNKMNVLSLFDGISCARVALDRAGITVGKYYACEIDKNAIAVSQRNYPDIVRLGDVRNVTGFPVDLLIGGSPCQDLSIGKKDRKGLDGERSGLFWEFVRIWKECKPRWFVLENVASMPKADRDIITREMGVEPVMIDASLVSAQCRKRLFWTNIVFQMPVDRGILLKDILEDDAEVDERMVTGGKSYCLTATYSKVTPSEGQVAYSIEKKQRTMVKVGCSIRGRETDGVYTNKIECRKDGKASALTTSMHSKLALVAEVEETVIGRNIGRRLNASGKREDDNKELPISRRIEMRTDGKCGTLTSVTKDNLVIEPTRIRKLTPVECERLQCLPDGYTEGIAVTNRYKVLGNAFNVEVVAGILAGVGVQGSR